MPTVVLKLFARPRFRTDGRTKRRIYASPFGEHTNTQHLCYHDNTCCFGEKRERVPQQNGWLKR